MRVNSIKQKKGRYFVSITFCDENEERNFLQNLIGHFGAFLPVNCMLTDLDTSYSAYEEYFPRENYYVFHCLTSASIFAYELSQTEIQDVISNWGYYTIDALFALGVVGTEVKHHKPDGENEFKSMPIVITQVLDNSLDINLDQYYFEEMSKFLVMV